ncbi:MAG TPA: hypothetical protein VFO19_16050 [Vicinamibacterales bacterium]|nr:hypothetical protein [Vicinamibacterales bacterium]
MFGLALLAIGVALLWTQSILIGAAACIGISLLLFLAGQLVRTDPFDCPNCQHTNDAELLSTDGRCVACRAILERTRAGWRVLESYAKSASPPESAEPARVAGISSFPTGVVKFPNSSDERGERLAKVGGR